MYVGVITHQFNPATPTNNIAIFPLQSGYRDAETKKLHLTINYATIVQKMRTRVDELALEIKAQEVKSRENADLGDGEGSAACLAESSRLHDEWEDMESRLTLFEVIVPVSQIVSIFFFDEVTYEEYFLNESPSADGQPKKDAGKTRKAVKN